MKRFEKSTIVLSKVAEITCDKCHKSYHRGHEEFDEFLSISFIGGYNNKTFKDGTKVEADLCQYCSEKLLRDFARISR